MLQIKFIYYRLITFFYYQYFSSVALRSAVSIFFRPRTISFPHTVPYIKILAPLMHVLHQKHASLYPVLRHAKQLKNLVQSSSARADFNAWSECLTSQVRCNVFLSSSTDKLNTENLRLAYELATSTRISAM